MVEEVELREVEESDLPAFFAHQLDPIANQMAAFPARERDAFMTHWLKILADDTVVIRTIVHGTEIVGNIVCFEQSGKLMIGYWLGRSFWGRGFASQALREFVSQVPGRPLHAFVAKGNLGSIRVLEKSGFEVSGECSNAAATGGDVVEEFLYKLAE
jgi:RimJ/RimL family protein N-acetyltransferase